MQIGLFVILCSYSFSIYMYLSYMLQELVHRFFSSPFCLPLFGGPSVWQLLSCEEVASFNFNDCTLFSIMNIDICRY